MVIFAVTNGYLDDVPVTRSERGSRVPRLSWRRSIPTSARRFRTRKVLGDDLTARLRAAIAEYKQIAAR